MVGKREIGIGFGAGRALFGLGYVLDPQRAGLSWIGNLGAQPGPKVAFRSLGARDLVLGAGAASAAARGVGEAEWFAAHCGADIVDLVGTLLAGEAIPPASRKVAPLVAGASALAAGALAFAYSRD
ncbi:hypothetical protein HJD18_06390 [Thermoleophilia bacterium SCSIO 60948]|nr:hypothetical protein HJD18_06390 [Thermoleophilia bacterium SCSIO 60948]